MTRFSLTSAALIISTLLFHQSRAADPLPSKVLTKEQQAELTPQSVLTELIAGNKRFTSNVLTERHHSKQVREAYAGQFPKAVVLSCLDSRIPVEDVFDRGVGDIFVARVAHLAIWTLAQTGGYCRLWQQSPWKTRRRPC